MGFDLKKFRKAKFKPREEKVPVISTAYREHFFSEGDEKVFLIRALTGEELFYASEAPKRLATQKAAVEVLSSIRAQDKSKFKEMFGVDGDPTDAYCIAVETLSIAIVDPDFSLQDIVILAKTASGDFKYLYHKVQLLTGAGFEVGEPKPSGETPKSKQPSTSDTPGEKCSTS